MRRQRLRTDRSAALRIVGRESGLGIVRIQMEQRAMPLERTKDILAIIGVDG
jgi:hypothetical protein